MYLQFPLLLRNVEDLLFERGIDISDETVCQLSHNSEFNDHTAVTIAANIA